MILTFGQNRVCRKFGKESDDWINGMHISPVVYRSAEIPLQICIQDVCRILCDKIGSIEP